VAQLRGGFRPDPSKSEQVNRGAYLVEAVAHCGECHTPRNIMGGSKRSMLLAGDRGVAPNITPDQDTGIGKWSDGDLMDLLTLGLTIDGDAVGGAMGEMVQNSTSKMTPEDLRAIIAYLRSVPPVRNAVRTGH
jgi:mono/diheme cytochrome c family protein